MFAFRVLGLGGLRGLYIGESWLKKGFRGYLGNVKGDIGAIKGVHRDM